MAGVVIAIGSNVGDRLANLHEAVSRVRDIMDVRRVSSVFETAPMYELDQPTFLNAALSARTEMAPHRLLATLKEIEAEMGRHTSRRYGPREIDLDLIAYGRLAYRYLEVGVTKLVVPHPRVGERRFVLAPMAEIAPDLVLPGLGVVCRLLTQTNDQAESVRKLEDAVL